MNAAEIKRRLQDRVEAVCAHLLPNGKRVGREWQAGSIDGEPGASLKVSLDPASAGVWADFAHTYDAGDIFDLWQKRRGISFADTLAETAGWLGLPDRPERHFDRPRRTKPFQRPRSDAVGPLATDGDVFGYLVCARGLDPDILHRYRVGQVAHATHGPTAVFPCCEPSGKDVDLLKFLAVRRGPNGEKTVWSSTDSRDHLFGWQAISPDARTVTITEGEIDALTVAGWHFPAMSIPRGVKSFEWLEHDFDDLERFERIYLCLDNDAPGRECAAQIAARLGRERCFFVSLPDEYKDANAALVDGHFVGPDYEDCVARAETLDPPELRGAVEFGPAVGEIFWPTDPRSTGTEPPIDLPWRCRPSEFSIWTGFSGHGKSLLLTQFLLHDAWQGERVCFASFEIPPAKTLAILVRMVLGGPPRDTAEKDRALAWLDGRFWFLDRRGSQHWSKFLPTLDYAARRYGCTRFAIDSLLFCGVGADDYAAQKEFAAALTGFAATHAAHVHLIAHSRKKEDESRAPGKLDVKGTGDITDMCDNGFTVWRNKSKEQQLEQVRNQPGASTTATQLAAHRDAALSMWKHRESGEEPFRNLWLHKPSLQFLGDRNARPFDYLVSAGGE